MIDDLWYKNSIIYCLSVGSYMDAKSELASVMKLIAFGHLNPLLTAPSRYSVASTTSATSNPETIRQGRPRRLRKIVAPNLSAVGGNNQNVETP